MPLLRRYMKAKLGERYSSLFRCVPDNDLALEWCENRVIEAALPARHDDGPATPEQYELFENLTPSELKVIVALLHRRTYQQGESIINAGDEASELFFLARGAVRVLVPLVPLAPAEFHQN